MNKIFVVVAYGGQYEDAWENSLFACATQVGADLAVLELQERDERIKLAAEKLVSHFNDLKAKHPLVLDPLPAMPKGPAKPTKETNKDYQRVMAGYYAENQRVWAINQARQNAWNEELAGYQREYAKAECGLSDDDLTCITFPTHSMYCFGDKADYCVEELELR